jgi:hypothetical protein
MARAYIAKASNAIVVGALLSVSGIAESAPFPAPLLGKSVTVNWNTNRQQKFEGSDEVVLRVLSSSLRVYISTSGRAFSKELVAVTGGGGGRRSGRGGGRGGGSFESDQAPGDSRNSTGGNRIVHFDGGALLVDSPFIAGARRISITFDAGYSSCGARVIFGREGGSGPIRQRSVLSGRRFEVVSIQTSTPSCSIRSGNVFGEQ